METKKLEDGSTPFDSLSHEELLRQAQRLYMATEALLSVAMMNKVDGSPYWGRAGSGGIAILKGQQALAKARAEYSDEDMYRSFYRYAGDLLFDDNLGFNWAVCDKCGEMISVGSRPHPDLTGKAHREVSEFSKCDGSFQKLTWDDLKPA